MQGKISELIPLQLKGKKTDLKHSEVLPSNEAAVKCFTRAHKRLLNPDVWHQLGGVLSAAFYLIDGAVNADPYRLAKVNDFLKIDIPGPGPVLGKGYDWVKIAQIEYESDPLRDEESVGMKVIPCADPGEDSNEIAHFFTEEASSTFIIMRSGNEVTSYYYGRNETPNIKTSSTVDNIRNTIVAGGALASLSEAQWLALIKGFLQEEIGG